MSRASTLVKLPVGMTGDASGNIGIGVTPSAWNAAIKVLEMPDSGFLAFANTNGNISTNTFFDTAYKYKATAAAARYSQSSGAHAWYNAPSGTAGNAITFTTAMTLDASGNLGLGAIPSAWGIGNYKGFQIGGSASIMGRANGSDAYFMSNAYFDQTNYRYTQSRPAALYSHNTGSHYWFNAPSGTAGDAITFTTAMTLNASGDLLVGNTTSTYGSAGRGLIEVNGSNNALIALKVGGTPKAYWHYNGTNVDFLASSGVGMSLSTNGNTAVSIDTSRRVTIPNQPAFNAYSPAVTGNGTIVVWGSTRLNTGSCYSTTTGIFTAPIAGNYFFTFNSLMKANNDYVRLEFRVNGVADTAYGDTLAGGSYASGNGWSYGWSYISVGMSIILPLAQNDTVSVYNAGPCETYGAAYGTFSGYLLG